MGMNEIQIAQYLDQARSLVEEEKVLHAVQLYSRLIRSEPKFVLPYLELSSLYVDNKQHQAAVALLERAVTVLGDDNEILFHLGNLHVRLQEYDRAISIFKQLVGKKIPQVHFNLGVAYFYKNNVKLAEEHFRLTLKYDPHFPRINESIGELLFKRRAYTEAIDFLKRGIDADPYNAVNHYLLGLTYQKLYNWNKAHAEFVLAIDMDPTEALNWQLCGETLMYLKRFPEAEPYLRKAVELQPHSVDALISLGKLLALKGDEELSQEYIGRALKIDPAQARISGLRWGNRSSNRRQSNT